jgi:hypothetical protein
VSGSALVSVIDRMLAEVAALRASARAVVHHVADRIAAAWTVVYEFAWRNGHAACLALRVGRRVTLEVELRVAANVLLIHDLQLLAMHDFTIPRRRALLQAVMLLAAEVIVRAQIVEMIVRRALIRAASDGAALGAHGSRTAVVIVRSVICDAADRPTVRQLTGSSAPVALRGALARLVRRMARLENAFAEAIRMGRKVARLSASVIFQATVVLAGVTGLETTSGLDATSQHKTQTRELEHE